MFAMKNICYLFFLLITTVCYHGVGADGLDVKCFKLYDNGTMDDQVFKECATGDFCCGEENTECCRVSETYFNNPYWTTRLFMKIALLLLAIGTGVRCLYKKCHCKGYKEPEHLVFVDQSTVASGAPPFHPPPYYQPYPTIATGHFQPNMTPNMATNMTPNMAANTGTQVNMSQGPCVRQMEALNSFNPYNTHNHQGYNGPLAFENPLQNPNNPQQINQNPSKPSTITSNSNVSDSNDPINRQLSANFI